MADFNKPLLTDLYTSMVNVINDKTTSTVKWLDGTTDSNLPNGAKRWNSTNKYFEKLSSGVWSPLAAKYMIDVDTVDGCTVNNSGTSSTDLWTASKINTELGTKLPTTSYTAADILTKIKTVDGSSSGLDADLLDGQHGSYYNNGDNIVWGTTNTIGKFYTGTTNPTGSTRLNYSGYFHPSALNLTVQGDTTNTASHVFVETGSDGFVRPKTLANFKSEIFESPTFTGTASGAFSGTLNGADTATIGNANTICLRDASGDVSARLFRSDYDTTNASIGYIMTQVDTVSNNYIRPSTPAQVASAIGAITNTSVQALHATDPLRISGNTLYLYNGSGAYDSVTLPDQITASSNAAIGYIKFDTGLIIQWGSVASTAAIKTVTFPLAFPNACRQVIVSAVSSTLGCGSATTWTKTTANVVAQNINNGGVAATATWIAIGY